MIGRLGRMKPERKVRESASYILGRDMNRKTTYLNEKRKSKVNKEIDYVLLKERKRERKWKNMETLKSFSVFSPSFFPSVGDSIVPPNGVWWWNSWFPARSKTAFVRQTRARAFVRYQKWHKIVDKTIPTFSCNYKANSTQRSSVSSIRKLTFDGKLLIQKLHKALPCKVKK